MKKTPRLFIVIPCYNEQEVLPITAPLFLNKILSLAEAGKITPDSRVLFVNDGSRDRTWDIIRMLSKQDEHYIGICQSRNRGHQAAVLAGLMEAKDMCDITISIDCDGQDDIDAMDKMVDAYLEGYEVVYGVRSSRETDTFFKRFTAEGFYKFLAMMGAEVVFNHADYRLISSRVLQEFANYKEVNLYLRGMVPLVGFPSTSVSYSRAERIAGESHYPLKKMLGLAVDGVTSLSVKLRPRHLHCLRELPVLHLGAHHRAVRQGGRGLGQHDLHHLLCQRRAAHLPRHHRRVHRQDLHGDQAETAVYYQRENMGRERMNPCSHSGKPR